MFLAVQTAHLAPHLACSAALPCCIGQSDDPGTWDIVVHRISPSRAGGISCPPFRMMTSCSSPLLLVAKPW